MSRDLSRLRLFAILAPAGFVFVVGYLVRGPFHHELHHYPGWIYLFSGAAVAVLAFSLFVFALINRLERRVLDRTASSARCSPSAKRRARRCGSTICSTPRSTRF